MKLLFCGDVVGRSGRDAVIHHVPRLREKYDLDAVIVNVDNAAGGFGVTADIIRDFSKAGVDIFTGGDHVFDQKDALSLLSREQKLLRPHNFPPSVAGSGCRQFEVRGGKKLVVLHLLGQVFHKEYLDSPFACAEESLKPYRLGNNVDAILVDMHAEATSEKMAMGVFLDGRVSAVVGSHTHVPTADTRVLKGGTAYQTDTGMCGDYDSIIGFEPTGPMQQFQHKFRKVRMEPASGTGTLSACIITLKTSGLAESIEYIALKN